MLCTLKSIPHVDTLLQPNPYSFRELSPPPTINLDPVVGSETGQ